jgi:chorismate-pyruvate lyase
MHGPQQFRAHQWTVQAGSVTRRAPIMAGHHVQVRFIHYKWLLQAVPLSVVIAI